MFWYFPRRSRWRVWRLWRLRVVKAAFHSGSGGYVTRKPAISTKFTETVLRQCMLLKSFPLFLTNQNVSGAESCHGIESTRYVTKQPKWRKTLVQLVKTELRTHTCLVTQSTYPTRTIVWQPRKVPAVPLTHGAALHLLSVHGEHVISPG